VLPRKPWLLNALLLAAVFSLGGARTFAQVFDLDRDRELVAVLNGQWHFHPGDDPHWSDPAFDDSRWPLIRGDKSWSDQGYQGMSGTAWYRAKVRVSADAKQLAIYVPRTAISTSYQIFIDGTLVGGSGGMPPHEHAELIPQQLLTLPPIQADHGGVISLAIRVWHWPAWAKFIGGGMSGGLRIGDPQILQELSESNDHNLRWSMSGQIFLSILQGIAGLSALSLFLMRRREQEYLWFALMLLVWAIVQGYEVYFTIHPIGVVLHDFIDELIWWPGECALVAFYFRLLRAKRDWLFWAAITSVIAYLLFHNVVVVLIPMDVGLINAFDILIHIPVSICVVVLLIQRTKEAMPDARLLLFPVLLQEFQSLLQGAIYTGRQTGWFDIPSRWFFQTSLWPFPFSFSNLADGLFLVTVLAILVHRFTRTRREEERISNELDSARTVQSVLIPTEIPDIPGFVISAVYKPATQVGGDLFQILPIRSGGVLVIIGDVSGKGMPAAMTVSLLVGTVRTLAHFTQSPGEILSAMNQRMLARSSGGFTTCLALKVDADGTMTVANAGHIAPYLDGIELTIENGLPLGLSADGKYEESTFQLRHDEQLTLMTDGVIEARDRTGELFGFERVVHITTSTADAIARSAQEFGQEDDITVVTLTRRRHLEPMTAPLSTAAKELA